MADLVSFYNVFKQEHRGLSNAIGAAVTFLPFKMLHSGVNAIVLQRWPALKVTEHKQDFLP